MIPPESRILRNVSLMQGHIASRLAGMSLHRILVEKLNAALEACTELPLTPRAARLPAVPGKVHAVTGMRRAGKTTYLHQLLQERRRSIQPERAVYEWMLNKPEKD